MKNNRYVITGCPGAGKTTTLEILKERGYIYMPDSAREIIKRRKLAGESPRPSPDEFGWQMFEIDISNYNATPSVEGPVFFDRAIPDALGFLKGSTDLPMSVIEKHLGKYRYNNLVFIMPPWEHIYTTDSERDQNYLHSVAVYEASVEWYRKWDYETIEVPRADVEDRANFILSKIEVQHKESGI